MSLIFDAMSGVGGILLPLVAALLFEEFTFGGLVRLFLVRRPHSSNIKSHSHQMRGGAKCSH